MKNFYLAVGSIFLISSGFAQQLKSLPSTMNTKQAAMNIKTTKPFKAKADGDVIYSNTFSNPADWVEVDNSTPLTAGGWAIGTAAPDGFFSEGMGAIQSTTAADGFALFDSDNIYQAEGQQDASLELATGIDFTTKPNVTMEFQSYHRKFRDSIYVEFKIGAGAWGNAIEIDPDLGSGNSSENPTIYSMNVSSIVGGQADVKIRFRYRGQWDYAWMVDDLVFTETYEHDLELTRSFMTTEGLDYYSIPTSQTDFPGVTFGAEITNQGYGAQANAALSVKINSAAPVLSSTKNLASLAIDTFSIETPIQLAPGTNTILVSADLGTNTDGYNVNNTRTITVTNGGTNYSRSNGQVQLFTNYTAQEDGMRIGNAMFIYNDMTISGVRVRIDNKEENIGQELQMEIYREDETESTLISSNTAAIVEADLGGYVFIPAIAGENELYAGETITVYVKHPATEDFVRIGLAQAVLDRTTFMYFGEETQGYYINNAAMIELVETNGGTTGLNELNNNAFGLSVYPNPANDQANISFNLENNASVNVTVTDLSGKAVYSAQVNKNEGKNTMAINTSNFSNGIYMVKFEANNVVSTQKLVIKK